MNGTKDCLLPCIASAQKDEFYVKYLSSIVTELMQRALGPSASIKWNSVIQLASDLAFYTLTTLGNLQTLGEEYTGLIQVDATKTKMASLPQRFCLVLLQAGFPFCMEKVLQKMENNSDETCQNQIPKIRTILIGLKQFHLSLFYLHGVFYSLSKRFSRVHYLAYLKSKTDPSFVFQLLGYLSLWESLAAICVQCFSLYKDLKKKKGRDDLGGVSSVECESHDSATKCGLCLQPRSDTTVTLCGHLFCWSCIYSWTNTKPECPICREQLDSRKLVKLMNFEWIEFPPCHVIYRV